MQHHECGKTIKKGGGNGVFGSYKKDKGKEIKVSLGDQGTLVSEWTFVNCDPEIALRKTKNDTGESKKGDRAGDQR